MKDKKNRIINIRVSELELYYLNTLAKRHNISISKLLRENIPLLVRKYN